MGLGFKYKINFKSPQGKKKDTLFETTGEFLWRRFWIFAQLKKKPKSIEMEKVKENLKSETQPPPNHQMDADDDDENVKQLKECSSLYLSLQVCVCFPNHNHHLFDYPIFNESLKIVISGLSCW